MTQTKKLSLAAMFLALALVLPFLTGQIPQIGSMLCPMHIPALLCGFFCGAPWGLLVGFAAPLLRSMIFGMPPMFPTAVSMAFELAAYGAVSGFLYARLPRRTGGIYAALLAAMLAGRLVWGFVRLLLAGFDVTKFSLAMFWSGAVTTAIPGILVQLILVPVFVLTLRRHTQSAS